MAVVTSNIRVAVTGALSVGATTATAPTSPTSTLTGFTDLGGCSVDGLPEARDRSLEQIRVWQLGAVGREIVTESSFTLSCTLVETKLEVIELFYGATVTADTGFGSIVINPSSTGGRKSFVLDVVDGDELIRLYIPEGEVTEVGEVTHANGEAITYPITIAAYYNAGIGGSAQKFYSAFGS